MRFGLKSGQGFGEVQLGGGCGLQSARTACAGRVGQVNDTGRQIADVCQGAFVRQGSQPRRYRIGNSNAVFKVLVVVQSLQHLQDFHYRWMV